jgi:RND family efflux transporter MFP subunit
MTRIILILFLLLLPFSLHAEELRARLEWAHTVELRAFESGIVNKVNVLEGEFVSKGEVILELDPRDFDIKIQSANSRVKQAEAAYDKARREEGWQAELFDQGMVSENEMQDYKINLLEAEAGLESARAELQQEELSLERSVIKAPFDGIVVAIRSWEGQVILKTLQKDPLVEFAQRHQMVARARVSANKTANYQVGQSARVKIGKNWREGKIYRIGAVSEGVLEQGVAYAVDILFQLDDNEMLRPGHFCTVSL